MTNWRNWSQNFPRHPLRRQLCADGPPRASCFIVLEPSPRWMRNDAHFRGQVGREQTVRSGLTSRPESVRSILSPNIKAALGSLDAVKRIVLSADIW